MSLRQGKYTLVLFNLSRAEQHQLVDISYTVKFPIGFWSRLIYSFASNF